MAGTVTYEISKISKNLTKVIFTCTADASAATFPATTTTDSFAGKLSRVVTNPGATAPQDNWDFTLADADGIDLLNSEGANRHTTTSQECFPKWPNAAGSGYVYAAKPFHGTLTLTVSGNNVNSAIVVITAFIEH